MNNTENNEIIEDLSEKNNFLLKNKKNVNIRYKFLIIWVVVVMIITIIYFGYWYFNYEFHPVAYYDINRQKYLRNNTPVHPPPLVNFMDPPDTFGNKYVKIEDLIIP